MTTAPRSILEVAELPVEGALKVTGAAPYLADLRRPGLLHAAFVRSPFPHALVVRVDTSRAGRMPGVAAVLSGADVRPRRLGRRLQDWPLLAWDRVRFVGDPVAVVAARTLAEAEAAAEAVEVEYDELPAVLDPIAALAPDAPILHPDRDEHRYLGGERPATSHPNVQGHAIHEHGDVAAAFATAAHVVAREYRVARTFHGHLEPHGSIVRLDGDRYLIDSTNKSPFRFRDHLEAGLDIPPEGLVIDAGFIGGDFGGKGFSADDYVLTMLARQTGRPVRSVPRYADDLRSTNTRHAAILRLRTGVDRDGRIVAHEAVTIFDGGAYAAAKGNVNLVPGGSLHSLVGYHVPNARIEVTSVYTNQVPGGHARAPGQPQNSFAAESQMDLLARVLGVDPLELRLRNAIRPGEVDVLGRRWEQSAMVEVIETLGREMAWDRPRPPARGRGMAIGARSSPSGGRDARVELRVRGDGRVEVVTGVPDQGGGAHTMLQRVVAESLGLPLERVTVRRAPTDEAAYDLGAGGSRVTPVVGGAAQAGAAALAGQLDARAPGLDRLEQLAVVARSGGVAVLGEFEHPAGQFCSYAFGVEVEIDDETGEIHVLDGVFVADVGAVINPHGLHGQLLGGLVAGLGQALMEEVRIEDGVIATANLGDYKLPTVADVPPLRVVVIANRDGGGPFGAKSAGELGNVPVAPAIANALEDASGCRIVELPITAERVHAALRARRGAGR